MCHEVAVDYEPKLIGSRSGATNTPQFQALNAKEKIPVLVDGDFVLTESAAIVTYLADRYGEPGMFTPLPGTQDRAHYDQWLSFVKMELDAHTLYVIRKHRDLADLYGAAPAAIDAAIEGFHKQVAVATTHLRHRDYLVGNHFTGADLMLASVLQWAHVYGLTLDPRLDDYRLAQNQRPAYLAAAKLNFSITPTD